MLGMEGKKSYQEFVHCSYVIQKFDDVKARLRLSGKDEDMSPFTAVDRCVMNFKYTSILLHRHMYTHINPYTASIAVDQCMMDIIYTYTHLDSSTCIYTYMHGYALMYTCMHANCCKLLKADC